MAARHTEVLQGHASAHAGPLSAWTCECAREELRGGSEVRAPCPTPDKEIITIDRSPVRRTVPSLLV